METIKRCYLAKNPEDPAFPIRNSFDIVMQNVYVRKQDRSPTQWQREVSSYREGYVKTGFQLTYITNEDPPNEWWERRIGRPVVKMRLPPPPEKGYIPLNVQLFLPDIAADEAEDLDQFIVLAVKQAVAFPMQGKRWGGPDESEPFEYGCNWLHFDGMSAWIWNLDDSEPPVEVISDDWPDFDDVGEGLAMMNHLTDKFEVMDGLVEHRWYRLHFTDKCFVDDYQSGKDILFMILDTTEGEDEPSPAAEWNKMPFLATPYNTSEGPYPQESDGAPMDFEFDELASGPERPLLFIEWGLRDPSENDDEQVVPISNLKIVGQGEDESSIEVSWDKPTAIGEPVTTDILINEDWDDYGNPDTIAYTTKDQNANSAIINLLSDRPFKLFGRNYYTRSGTGGGKSNVVENAWPISTRLCEVRDEDGNDDNFRTFQKLYIGMSIFDAIPIAEIAAVADDVDEFGITDEMYLYTRDYIQMKTNVLIRKTSPASALEAAQSFARRFEGFTGTYGLDNMNVKVNQVSDGAISDATMYLIKKLKSIEIAFGDGSSYIIDKIYELDSVFTGTKVYFNGIGDFKEGDVICLMDGDNPILLMVTSLGPDYLNVEFLSDDPEHNVPTGTYLYRVEPYLYTNPDVFHPHIRATNMSALTSTWLQSRTDVTIATSAPLAMLSVNKKEVEFGSEATFYAVGSTVFNSKASIGDGVVKSYFKKDVDPSNPPTVPPSGWNESAWKKDYDWTFNTISVSHIYPSTVPDKQEFEMLTGPAFGDVRLGDIFEFDDSWPEVLQGQWPVTDVDGTHICFDMPDPGNPYSGDPISPVQVERYVALCVVDFYHFSDYAYISVLIHRVLKFGFSRLIDLSAMTNGYKTEEVDGGRVVEVSQSLNGDAKIDSNVEAIKSIMLAGTATTISPTHPIAVINQWRDENDFVGLPDDLVTLLYLEKNKSAAYITTEKRIYYLALRTLPRSREFGLLEIRNWRAEFVKIGELQIGN